MTITIGGQAMPASMSNRALNYGFERAKIIGRNGEGATIEADTGCTVLWVWAYLDGDEYDWIVDTVLNAAASATFTSTGNTVLYNERRTEETFDHAIVLRPSYKALSGGTYHEVSLVIDSLWTNTA
jgi:hypothetical protein